MAHSRQGLSHRHGGQSHEDSYFTMDTGPDFDPRPPSQPAPGFTQAPGPFGVSPFDQPSQPPSGFGSSVPPGPFASSTPFYPSGAAQMAPGQAPPGFGPPPQMQQQQPNFFGNQQQQFLMAAGQQLLTNPVTAAAIDAYSQSLVDKSKGWIGNVKSYFAVDTSYVAKKLLLIFLPFLHKDWTIRYNAETVAPRDEPNLPDLYIPSMAFITYILLSGYMLGLQDKFAPEQLGIYASSALAWLLLEVFLVSIAKYLLNISNALGFFHQLAFGGYKFVCICTILLATIPFGGTGYLATLAYTTFSLGYFLLRTLSAVLETSSQSAYHGHSNRPGQYLIMVICVIQPVVMYFLTYGFK